MSETTRILMFLVAVFLVQLAIPSFTSLLYLDPLKAFSEPWRLISSIFLHGGFLHLFFNGYALLLFGSLVEKRVGGLEFIKLFLLSGLFASLFYVFGSLIGLIPPIPALGASGAVYGIMGAAAVLFPDLRLFVMFIPMRMREAVGFWVLVSIVGTFNPASGIAHLAHLGGLLFGYLYAKKFFFDGEEPFVHLRIPRYDEEYYFPPDEV